MTNPGWRRPFGIFGVLALAGVTSVSPASASPHVMVATQIATASASVPLQEADAGPAAPEPSAQGAASASVGQSGSGLPTRAPEPRTMRRFWPMFVAFAAAWIGISMYALSFGGALREISRRVDETSRAIPERRP